MEQQNKEYADEINLYDLWKVIVKRRRIIIGLFLIVVISTAIVSLFMPKIYRGEVKLSIIDNRVSMNLEGGFGDNKHIIIIKRAESAKEIIDLMGSIDDGKKKVIFPKSYTSVKSVKLKALKNVTNEITTTVEAKNTDDIPVAVAELVDSLNNMELVKASLKEEREILTQRSIELSHFLKTAQELVVAYNKLIREGKFAAIGFNPLELNENIVDIKNEKYAVEQALSKLKNGRIQIVTPPSIASPKTTRNVLLAGMLGILLGLFLAFFIEYIGNIKNKNCKPADGSLTD